MRPISTPSGTSCLSLILISCRQSLIWVSAWGNLAIWTNQGNLKKLSNRSKVETLIRTKNVFQFKIRVFKISISSRLLKTRSNFSKIQLYRVLLDLRVSFFKALNNKQRVCQSRTKWFNLGKQCTIAYLFSLIEEMIQILDLWSTAKRMLLLKLSSIKVRALIKANILD